MQKKIYAGSGKKKSDTWLSVSLNMDKIKDYVQEYNGTKFVKLNVNISAQPDKFGKDVQLTVDTYDPKNSNGNSGRQAPATSGYTPQANRTAKVEDNESYGDLPF